jgi:hypothetical protein
VSELALLGGPRAVTRPLPVWPRIDEKTLRDVERVLSTEPLCPVGNDGIQGEFENRFAALHGRRFALATNGGTAALMLSVHGAGVLPGDEVICSPFTWGASIACVLQCAALPVFADIDPETYALDPASIRTRITPRTRAIVVVHLFGYPADMDPILEVAREHGLRVIEDCAQATGATYRGRRVGSLGDFGAFSLQASKTLTGGEGGVLVCDDREMYERAMSMGTHPVRLEKELVLPEFRRRIDSLAFNFRMHTAAAAIANAQLPHLDGWTAERGRSARSLYQALGDLPYVRAQEPPREPGSRHAYYHVPFRYVPGVLPIGRDRFLEALVAEGVPAGLYVRVPFHLRRRIRDHDWMGRGFPWSLVPDPPRYREGDCPNAERAAHEEWQIKASLHERDPELLAEIARAVRKVGHGASALTV